MLSNVYFKDTQTKIKISDEDNFYNWFDLEFVSGVKGTGVRGKPVITLSFNRKNLPYKTDISKKENQENYF